MRIPAQIKLQILLLPCALIFLNLFFVKSVLATVGVNRQINFQGKVVSVSTGNNVADDDYDFVFKLYNVSSGGSPIWTETRTGGNQVTVTDGIFRVALGSVTTFASAGVDFTNDSLYLGVEFDGDGEMGERIRLTSAAYALFSEQTQGLTIPSGETVSFAESFNTSGAFALTLTTTGTTNVTLPTTGTLVTLAGNEILTNKTVGSTGLVFSGASTDVDTAAAEGLTLQGRAASSFVTTSGTISVQPAGTGTISTFQIGAGGSGSTTPDFFGLDVKSDTGDPAGGFEGAMYYNTSDNKFRCYQDSAWTNCIGTGGGGAFSDLTSGTNTVAAMVVDTGASLNFSGSGTINASTLLSGTWAIPGTIGSSTPNTGAFTTLTSSGATTLGTGASTTNTFGAGASSVNTIGSVTTPGALTLHGATSLDNTFTVSGSNLTTLGGNLTVSGTAWTATPTISGLITATSGLTANGTLTANSTFVLGDDGELGSINTSDWNISTTGDLTGIGGLTMDGAFSQTGSGTFGTGTGAVSLNGDVAIAAGKGLTFTSGAGTFAQTFTGTTTTAQTLTADSLTSGNGISVTSTSTGLSTGSLGLFDWSPGSATVATGDLFSLNVGANGILGNIFNIKNNSSSVLGVSQTAITANLPASFNAAGDVSMAYDLNFTNPTSANIKSVSPLYLIAGEVFNSSDLTLRTFNSGNVIVDSHLFVSNPTVTGKALAILNQTEAQDIFSASASGVTKFTIQNDGDASASGNITMGGQLQIGRFENAPTQVGPGALYYNSTSNTVQFYNGSTWGGFGGSVTYTSGDGSGGTSHGSGLEDGTGGIGLLQGCSNNEILKWNDSSAVWACATDSTSAGAGVSTIQEGDSTIDGAATTIDFLAADFIVTSSPAGEANISIDYANSGILRNTDLISGDGAGGNSSGSGLETGTGGIGLLQGCANGEALIWDESNSLWECGAPTATTKATQSIVSGRANVAASQTNLAVETLVFTSATAVSNTAGATGFPAPANGSFRGCLIKNNAAITAGTLSLNFTVNGAATYTGYCAMDSTTNRSATSSLNSGTATFTAGDTIGISFTTNAGFLPTGTADYTVFWTVEYDSGVDLAETYYTSDESIGPGDLVSMDASVYAGVKKSSGINDSEVLGIISTLPGITLGGTADGPARAVPVALQGRVPLKVSTENGAIQAGDLLTASSIPGVAMKATKATYVVGQALSDYDQPGIGSVLVFIKNTFNNGDLDTTGKSGTQLLLDLTTGNGYEQGTEGSLSEIYTDRVVAGLDVITKSIFSADASISGTLKVGRLEADSIAGLDILTERIEDLENQLNSLLVSNESLETLVNKKHNIFEKLVTFVDRVVIKGEIDIQGRPTFNKDTAGIAVIPPLAKSVEVVFEKEYVLPPVVNITLRLNEASESGNIEEDIKAAVTNVSTKGFSIVMDQYTARNVEYHWVAIGVKELQRQYGKPLVDVGNFATQNLESSESGVVVSSPSGEVVNNEDLN